MWVTDLIHWKNHQHNEKSRQHNDSATNIRNQSPSLRGRKILKFRFMNQFLTLKNKVSKFFQNSNFSDFLGKSEISHYVFYCSGSLLPKISEIWGKNHSFDWKALCRRNFLQRSWPGEDKNFIKDFNWFLLFYLSRMNRSTEF